MSDEISINRKASRDYTITETIEAGLVLKGTEVKSLRQGHVNMNDAFARIEKDEVFLYQLDISPYDKGNVFNHEAKAVRKLLLHRNEILKLFGEVAQRGRTLVALKMYWKKNKVKVLLGLGIGKDKGDKRQDLKKAAIKKELQQEFKSSQIK
jgi:SsrA-binding protein